MDLVMAITIKEAWNEGPLTVGSSAGSCTTNYIAISDDPENDFRDDVLTEMISYLDTNDLKKLYGLVLDTINIGDRLSENDLAHWGVTVNYVNSQRKLAPPLPPPTDTRPMRWTFRSGSPGSVTMLRSLNILQESAVPAMMFSQATNWDWSYLAMQADRSDKATTFWTVDGIDMPLGEVEIGCDTTLLNSEVTAGYLIELATAASNNLVNDDLWQGFFAIGTMRFISFNAEQRAAPDEDPGSNDEPWDVSLDFIFSPTTEIADVPAELPAFGVPPGFGSVAGYKRGHEYVDVTTAPKVLKVNNPRSDYTIPEIRRIAVHQIYPTGSFVALFDTIR